ncbi:MAG: membrane protein insertase YidC [Bacteroidales bacterium]|nr:membrane protein insertase YidC [Bacteroidales bacterium]
MNRDQIIGLVAIFAILIGYSFWMQPSQEELDRRQIVQDSLNRVAQIQYEAERKLQEEQTKQIQEEVVTTQTQLVDGNTELQKNIDRFGIFAGSSTGENKHYIIENDLIKVDLASKGGRVSSVELKDYQAYDSTPLVLFKEDSSYFGITFFVNNRIVNTSDLYFKPYWPGMHQQNSEQMTVSGENSLDFAMRVYPGEAESITNPDQYIEFLYSLKGDSYMMDFNINLNGVDHIMGSNSGELVLDWMTQLRSQEKSVKDEQNVTTVFYKHYKDEVSSLNERKDDQETFKTRMKWIGFKQKFFASVLIADDYFLDASMSVLTDEKLADHGNYIKTTEASITLPFENKAKASIPMHFYFGPTKYSTLKSFDLEMEEMIPLGWVVLRWINKYAVITVFNQLEKLNFNYGIIILILTILLKIVLFPIAYKTYLSSAKMRVLKPEIEEITAKYPKPEDSMKKQQATMKLYKQAGVNPMAGCVPMLLQMPILIALFRFFPASIELRQQAFLWAEDLSSYDAIISWTGHIPFITDTIGNHISLFTLLMTISTIIYTKVNTEMMGAGNQQMPGMKMMMYLMPIFFFGFLNNYASGLSYYYFLANVITFSQMYLIRKFIDEDKIHAQIQKNKKKPVKKSKWAAKLEEAAKAKQAQAKRK